MENNIEKVKEKIAKLMSIADDPRASDNEVYIAMKKAQKLMISYNITKNEIKKEKEDVEEYMFENMYPIYYTLIVSVIAKNFRCNSTYKPFRQKCYINLYGLRDDLDVAIKICDKIFSFLKIKLKKYVKEFKESSYEAKMLMKLGATPDARVIKRSYCYGFSRGLLYQFEKNLIEAKEEYGEETALTVIGVPAIVEEYLKVKVKPKTVKRKYETSFETAEKDGRIDGARFKV